MPLFRPPYARPSPCRCQLLRSAGEPSSLARGLGVSPTFSKDHQDVSYRGAQGSKAPLPGGLGGVPHIPKDHEDAGYRGAGEPSSLAGGLGVSPIFPKNSPDLGGHRGPKSLYEQSPLSQACHSPEQH